MFMYFLGAFPYHLEQCQRRFEQAPQRFCLPVGFGLEVSWTAILSLAALLPCFQIWSLRWDNWWMSSISSANSCPGRRTRICLKILYNNYGSHDSTGPCRSIRRRSSSIDLPVYSLELLCPVLALHPHSSVFDRSVDVESGFSCSFYSPPSRAESKLRQTFPSRSRTDIRLEPA